MKSNNAKQEQNNDIKNFMFDHNTKQLFTCYVPHCQVTDDNNKQ